MTASIYMHKHIKKTLKIPIIYFGTQDAYLVYIRVIRSAQFKSWKAKDIICIEMDSANKEKEDL